MGDTLARWTLTPRMPGKVRLHAEPGALEDDLPRRLVVRFTPGRDRERALLVGAMAAVFVVAAIVLALATQHRFVAALSPVATMVILLAIGAPDELDRLWRRSRLDVDADGLHLRERGGDWRNLNIARHDIDRVDAVVSGSDAVDGTPRHAVRVTLTSGRRFDLLSGIEAGDRARTLAANVEQALRIY